MEKDLFKKINNEYFNDLIEKYYIDQTQEEIKKCFYDKKYKKIINLTEEETRLLRISYPKPNLRIRLQDLVKTSGEKWALCNKLRTIEAKLANTIFKINSYYMINDLDLNTKEFIRKPIEELKIEQEIKELLKKYDIYTLEELLIYDTIDWKKERIRTIMKLFNLLNQKKLQFHDKRYRRDRIRKYNLETYETVILEQNNIFTINDLLKSTIKEIRQIETIPENIKTKIENMQIVKYGKEFYHIDELNLSANAHHALTKSNSKIVLDIIYNGIEGLKKTRRIGVKSYLEIIDKIHELNMEFFDETKEELEEIEKIRTKQKKFKKK